MDNEKNIVLDDEKAILLNHNYDGIEELDNPLPNWWLIIFYGTIIFSVFYYGYYEMFGGPSHRKQLDADLAEIHALAPAPVAMVFSDDDSKNPQLVANGKVVFDGKCAACHRADGGGLVGPNLTDKAWIHGDGHAEAIAKVVAEGVADKGMPPWAALLSNDEMKGVVAFVVSLKGTQPPNPKEPQGTEVP